MQENTPEEIVSVREKDARIWGMWCHLAALAGFLGIPFGSVIGPLVVWLTKRNDHPFINEQGKEAVNFQISMILYALISLILCLILIGFLLLLIVIVADFILTIVAAIRTSEGKPFRYPMTIRFIQ